MNLQPFSTPFDGDFYGLSDRCASLIFATILKRVDAYAQKHGLSGLGFDDRLLLARGTGHWGWSPEIGSVATALRHGVTPEDWSWVAGQTKLALFLNDLLPSVDFEMIGRHPTAVAGHTLPKGRLIVCGDQERLTIFDGEGRLQLDLRRCAEVGANGAWTSHGQDELIRLGSGRVALLCNGDWQSYWQPELHYHERTPDRAAYRRRLETYLAFLEESSPEYYLWVVTLVRELVLLKQPDESDSERSSSFLLWPAHIHISENNAARNLATLVHEAAHQYFHMTLWLGPVVTPNAPDVHSTLRGFNRPLEIILLGYHAFGNALLALSSLPTGELIKSQEKADCQHWLWQLVNGMSEQLEAHRATYFTARGEEVYQPLKQRLIGAGLQRN